MATNVPVGHKSHLRVSDDNVTFLKVAEAVGFGRAGSAPGIVANHHDEPNFVSRAAGRADNTITGSHNYIYDDAAQLLIRTAYESRTRLYFKLMPVEQIGLEKFTGSGYVASHSHRMDDGGVQLVDFSIEVDGAVTAGDINANDVL